MKVTSFKVGTLAFLIAIGLIGCVGGSDKNIKDTGISTEDAENSSWYTIKKEIFKEINSYDLMMIYAKHGLNLNYPGSAQIASECIEVHYKDTGEIAQVLTIDNEGYKDRDKKFKAYNSYSSDTWEYNTIYHINTYDNSKESLEGLLEYYIVDEALDEIVKACISVYGKDTKKYNLYYSDGVIEISYNNELCIDIKRNLDIIDNGILSLEKLKEIEPLLDINAIKEMENFSIKTPFDKEKLLDLNDSSYILSNMENSEKNSRRLKIEKVWTVLGNNDTADLALVKYDRDKYGKLEVENVSLVQDINDLTIELIISGCDRFNRRRELAALIHLDTRDDIHIADVASKILNINKDIVDELMDSYTKGDGSQSDKSIGDNENISVYSMGNEQNIGIAYSFKSK